MFSAIIEIIVGWFVMDQVPSLVNAKGSLASVIKLVGVIILIGGFVHLLYSIV